MTSKPDLLYILAPSYSGSTLLTFLLAQHPRIATVGELKATKIDDVNRYRCSCGDVITDCSFWNSVIDECKLKRMEDFPNNFGTSYCGKNYLSNKIIRASFRAGPIEKIRELLIRFLPGVGKELEKISHRNFELSQIICELQKGDIFVDGSKDSVRLVHMLQSDLWNTKVIYLQRDGRGVSKSLMARRKLNFERASKEWLRTVTELQTLRQELDDSIVFDLKYEDMCERPDEVFKRIWSWLSIEDLAIQSRDFKLPDRHILGNVMRLSNYSEIQLDESWRTQLSSSDLELFDKTAGQGNRLLGYNR